MTEQEMKIRKWLNRAFYAEKKAKALEMLVEQCRERAEGLTRNICSCSGKTDCNDNKAEKALIRLAQMQEQAEESRIHAVEVTSEIWDAINALGDDDLEAVLIYRYIFFWTIEDTAESMGYEPRTIRRKIKKAIDKMSSDVLKCP